MAKSQKRTGREPKKPKSTKPKTVTSPTLFTEPVPPRKKSKSA